MLAAASRLHEAAPSSVVLAAQKRPLEGGGKSSHLKPEVIRHPATGRRLTNFQDFREADGALRILIRFPAHRGRQLNGARRAPRRSTTEHSGGVILTVTDEKD